MSKNFERVKRDILRDMKSQRVHSAESWASIFLENTVHLTSDEDQISFWEWIMNPEDQRNFPKQTYMQYDNTQIDIPEFQTLSLDDGTLVKNECVRKGFTTYIKSSPIEEKSDE